MECYVSLILKPKPIHRGLLASFLTSVRDGNTQGAAQALGQLGSEAVERFEQILSDSTLREYMHSFECIAVKKTTLSVDLVTGSHGFGFAVALIELLGPYCDRVTGVYAHDEEPPEDCEWPVKLTYTGGIVYANGQPSGQAVLGGGSSNAYVESTAAILELSIRFECSFDDPELASAFANLLDNKPQDLLDHLRRHNPESRNSGSEEHRWTYVGGGAPEIQGNQVSSYLIFDTTDAGVWRDFGPALALLGAKQGKVTRLSFDSLSYPTGIRWIVDGRVVQPELHALAGRRDEPLVAALWQDDVDRVQTLLADSAATLMDALRLAAVLGATQSLAALLAGEPGLINEPDAYGNTLLVNALLGDQVGVIHQLIAVGANVDATVHLTPVLRELEAIEDELIEEGSHWSQKAVYRYYREHDFVAEGFSAIEWALSRYQAEAAHLLLDHGAMLCWPDNAEFGSSLSTCIDGGSPELLQRLLALAVAEDRSEPEHEHWLDQAIYLQRYELAEMLLVHGCDINRPNASTETPLHTATLTHIVLQQNQSNPFLLARGADVDGVDGRGRTPFMRALAWSGEMTTAGIKAFHWLLAAGASLEAKDHEGRTAEWHANDAGLSLNKVLAQSRVMTNQIQPQTSV